MSKKGKEKPSYNVWQNVCFIVKNMLKTDKSLAFSMLVFVAASLGASLAALFLPKTVVQLLGEQVSVRAIVPAVLGFSAAIGLCEGLVLLMQDIQIVKRFDQSKGFEEQLLLTFCTTDYSNLARQDFEQGMEKGFYAAGGDDSACVQIFNVLQVLVLSVLGFVIYLAMLTAVQPLILILVFITSVAAFFLRKGVNSWEHDHDEERAKPRARIRFAGQTASELKYAKDIRIFGLTNWLEDIWTANKKLVDDFTKKVSRKQLAVDVFEGLTAFLREGLAYAYLIYMVLYRDMPVDRFVLLFGAIGGFSGYITGILEQYTVLHRFSLGLCRLREFLNYPQTFRHDGTKVPKADSYEIELRNVSFRYEGASEYALEHIDLKINAGEKLAVVGLNGAGKTTLIQLICGLYDPTEGEVLLNGVNIKNFDRNEYYDHFAAVFQDFSILPYSIAQNIAVAGEADIDYGRVKKCLALADIAEKVDSLPNKEHSLLVKSVNADAVQLSGGETQRLMLARALYKDAPILLLDEPTAALDPIAESKMYQHYDALSKGKTAVYISHRLASTFFCDRIILIADKGIAEEGTHAQLMALHGKYAELFEIQSHYYKEHPEGGDDYDQQ